MPFRRREYDFMLDDGLDTRIPVYSDEVFKKGIHFCAKFVGSMDIPRPQNRLEIVSSMRRIRYEFKEKGIKKQKILITVSAEGVFVYARRKPKFTVRWPGFKTSNSSIQYPGVRVQSDTTEAETPSVTESSGITGDCEVNSVSSGGVLGLGVRDSSTLNCIHQANLMFCHPIYRIFYVSHDSQDLNIFSYIARDGRTSVFRCHVFKAYKKLQAMRIVRTVGQAFDVCHRLALEKQENQKEPDVSKTSTPSSPADNSQRDTKQRRTTDKNGMYQEHTDTVNEETVGFGRPYKRRRNKVKGGICNSKYPKNSIRTTGNSTLPGHDSLNLIELDIVGSNVDLNEVDKESVCSPSNHSRTHTKKTNCFERVSTYSDKSYNVDQAETCNLVAQKQVDRMSEHLTDSHLNPFQSKQMFSRNPQKNIDNVSRRCSTCSSEHSFEYDCSHLQKAALMSPKSSSTENSESRSTSPKCSLHRNHICQSDRRRKQETKHKGSEHKSRKTHLCGSSDPQNYKLSGSFTVQDLVWMLQAGELHDNGKQDIASELRSIVRRTASHNMAGYLRPDMCQSYSVDTNLTFDLLGEDDPQSSLQSSSSFLRMDATQKQRLQDGMLSNESNKLNCNIVSPNRTLEDLKCSDVLAVGNQIDEHQDQLNFSTLTQSTESQNGGASSNSTVKVPDNNKTSKVSYEFSQLLLKLYSEAGARAESQLYIQKLLRQNRDMKCWLTQMSDRLKRLELIATSKQPETTEMATTPCGRSTGQLIKSVCRLHTNDCLQPLRLSSNILHQPSVTTLKPSEATNVEVDNMSSFGSRNPFRMPRSLSTFTEAQLQPEFHELSFSTGSEAMPTSSTMTDFVILSQDNCATESDPFSQCVKPNVTSILPYPQSSKTVPSSTADIVPWPHSYALDESNGRTDWNCSEYHSTKMSRNTSTLSTSQSIKNTGVGEKITNGIQNFSSLNSQQMKGRESVWNGEIVFQMLTKPSEPPHNGLKIAQIPAVCSINTDSEDTSNKVVSCTDKRETQDLEEDKVQARQNR